MKVRYKADRNKSTVTLAHARRRYNLAWLPARVRGSLVRYNWRRGTSTLPKHQLVKRLPIMSQLALLGRVLPRLSFRSYVRSRHFSNEGKVCNNRYVRWSVLPVPSVWYDLINPRRACAARVTVVGFVCVCVCLSVKSHLTSRMSNRAIKQHVYLVAYERQKIWGDLPETTAFNDCIQELANYKISCFSVGL